MKKLFQVVLAVIAMASAVAPAQAACTTIQAGTLLYQRGAYLAGQPLQVGVDPFGYNYQAHAFNGSYFNAYANRDGLPPYNGDDAAYLAANPSAAGHWAWPYRNDDVAMKWNDAWLANSDCDGDGKLDRHYGFPTYVGSGAWLTNHNGWTVSVGDREKQASEFIKIVAKPLAATTSSPAGYFGEGTVYVGGRYMGDQLWGDFAVIQYVLNDPSNGQHGLRFMGGINAGFGSWKP